MRRIHDGRYWQRISIQLCVVRLGGGVRPRPSSSTCTRWTWNRWNLQFGTIAYDHVLFLRRRSCPVFACRRNRSRRVTTPDASDCVFIALTLLWIASKVCIRPQRSSSSRIYCIRVLLELNERSTCVLDIWAPWGLYHISEKGRGRIHSRKGVREPGLRAHGDWTVDGNTLFEAGLIDPHFWYPCVSFLFLHVHAGSRFWDCDWKSSNDNGWRLARWVEVVCSCQSVQIIRHSLENHPSFWQEGSGCWPPHKNQDVLLHLWACSRAARPAAPHCWTSHGSCSVGKWLSVAAQWACVTILVPDLNSY